MRNTKILAPTLAIGIIILVTQLAFQNCAPMMANSGQPNNPSPFEKDNGIVLSPSIASMKTIAAGVVFNFVVDDACIKTRIADKSNRYFLDRYLNKVQPAADLDRLQQSLIQVTFASAIQESDLQRVKATDRCVLGIADDQGVEFKVNFAFSDPQAAQQNYIKQLGFDTAYETLKNETAGQKVVVAVVDSGFDLSRAGDMDLFPNLLGADLFDGGTPADDMGHGTQMASIIGSKPDNANGMAGLSGHVTQLMPLRVVGKDRPNTNLITVFEAVKRAINIGQADVINLSLGAFTEAKGKDPLVCDPVIGHLIFKAIEKGSFLVMSAGNHMRCEVVNGTKKCFSGETFSPKDTVFDDLDKDTYLPACWARYFKGAVSVTAMDASGRLPASFGNWGHDAVEIAAPGVDVRAQDLNGQFVNSSGTSHATAMVTAAAANIIAFYKKQGWYYNPWMIEDTLLNGSASMATLSDQRGDLVRLKKALNFESLKNYLVQMKSWNELERRNQFSDNPEAGLSRTLAAATQAKSIAKLDVFTRQPLLYVRDQAQVQAVLYYTNGDMEVVTDKVQWTIDKSGARINTAGLFLPTAAGNFKVTASYSGVSGATEILASNNNVVTGTNAEIESIEVVPNSTLNFFGFYACSFTDSQFDIRVNYQDGTRRYVSGKQGTVLTFVDVNNQLYDKAGWENSNQQTPFILPGRTVKVIGFYQGRRDELIIPVGADPAPPQITYLPEGALAIDHNAKTIDIWKKTYDEGRYLTRLIVATNTKSKYPDLLVDPACTVTNLKIVDELAGVTNPPIGSTYKLTKTFDYWASGAKQSKTVTYTQKIVDRKPIKLVLNALSKKPPIFYWAGFDADKIQALYEFSDGSSFPVQVQYLDFSFTASNPNAKICNRPSFSSTTEDRFSIDSFLAPNSAIQLKVTDKEFALSATLDFSTQAFSQVASSLTSAGPSSPMPSKLPLADKSIPPLKQGSNNLCNTNLPYAAGTGTQMDPWLVCTIDQLKRMKTSQGGHFKLGANIDLASIKVSDLPLKFTTFNGDGYRLSNVSLTDAEVPIRVFSWVREIVPAPYFYNVMISNVSIRTLSGGFVGSENNHAPMLKNVVIFNSKFYGSGGVLCQECGLDSVRGINIEAYADGSTLGGLAGQAKDIVNTQFFGALGVISPGVRYVGGIAGKAEHAWGNYVEADIRMGVNDAAIGGVAGFSLRSAMYNYFKGSILGANAGAVGGVFGQGSDRFGYYKGNKVIADLEGASATGGIVGKEGVGFEDNAFDGSIVGTSSVGGIAGRLTWAYMKSNAVNASVQCDGSSQTEACGGFVGNISHIPSCPTLPEFIGNSTAVKNLPIIGRGPLGVAVPSASGVAK